MDVKFAFALGQEVILENGLTGRVDVNSIVDGVTKNRISVEYSDKTGSVHSRWFDEDKLKAA
jgi:hypothetical protein